MDNVVKFFWPKECLSKQKRYIGYRMKKPQNPSTRQYVGLVCDLNSRMAQIPPLFNNNQLLDESKLMNSLANKAPKSNNVIIILQGFNPETGYLATFVEHCKMAKTTDNIAMAKLPV